MKALASRAIETRPAAAVSLGLGCEKERIMAAKLVKYYELVQAAGGPTAKARMAMITVVPSILAKETPDTPENIAKFRKAYKEVMGVEAPPV